MSGRLSISCTSALGAILITAIALLIHGTASAASTPQAQIVNKGVVELETGRAADISVQMAEDIASIIDDGSTRRVIPLVGKGPFQNLTDLRFLRGVDLAIVPSDALDAAREQRLFPGLETTLTYVAKLYNQELHVLARPDIKTLTDLNDQLVNLDLKDSTTSITATRLFSLLNVKPKLTNDDQQTALRKLRSGQIAALALVAAKPAPFFQNLKDDAGLHLLSIPLTQTVTAAYAPTRLTKSDYPHLVTGDQSADTIAIGNVLMVADLRTMPDRFRNISNFIETFFTGFPGLLEPGRNPKWQEVNINADFPGWVRHPVAEQWLQRNTHIAAAPTAETMKTLFSRFIDERRQSSGGGPMSTTDKDALFQQFQDWQHGQKR
jgi:TRAP-type uncharacterized transport system substrate-binding protein